MITIKEKGIQDYTSTWKEMISFTENRSEDTEDELWTLEHNSVFTQGLTGKSEHLLKETEIEVIQSDRGGQITYHGPGQIIVYCLIDIKRLGTIKLFLDTCRLSKHYVKTCKTCKNYGTLVLNKT